MADQLDCALDLMRRLPPSQIEDNLAGLLDLVPDLTEQLLSAVDQPLKIAHDSISKRDYLLVDYNRDGDSFRSPWSNKYDPPLDDGATPSAELRKFEIQANEVFDIYRICTTRAEFRPCMPGISMKASPAVFLSRKARTTQRRASP